LGSGNGYEHDPLIKPFANSAAIYPALQALPLGLDYLSSRMMRSSKGMVRRLWVGSADGVDNGIPIERHPQSALAGMR
jgi:hypothetical protein